ncbi:MAG: ubiquinol-cytochrome c reductase iron-sulfur subunit [Planctomycetota bacterium]
MEEGKEGKIENISQQQQKEETQKMTSHESNIEVVETKMDRKRRKFIISTLQLGWGLFTAACLGGGIATWRFMYPNVNYNPSQIFKLGKVEEYIEGEVDERWKKDLRIWVVKDRGIIYALKAVCTHLGCAPNWLAIENKFKCPCHGSGFRKNGIQFEGPAPRPLERVKIFLSPDGQITVDLSKTYRYELGQWQDENSFIRL